MKAQVTMCTVDVGQDLKELKEEMLQCMKEDSTHSEVYGIFNGQLFVCYRWAKTIDDIKIY